jgi:hypothetical protein
VAGTTLGDVVARVVVAVQAACIAGDSPGQKREIEALALAR